MKEKYSFKLSKEAKEDGYRAWCCEKTTGAYVDCDAEEKRIYGVTKKLSHAKTSRLWIREVKLEDVGYYIYEALINSNWCGSMPRYFLSLKKAKKYLVDLHRKA
jgi:hypothetical protein